MELVLQVADALLLLAGGGLVRGAGLLHLALQRRHLRPVPPLRARSSLTRSSNGSLHHNKGGSESGTLESGPCIEPYLTNVLDISTTPSP